VRFFTSDWHIGHENIIRFCDRPFSDAGHMDQSIINIMNDVVGADDELWILGDLAMGNWDKSMNTLKLLTAGKVFLVPGNHDKCHPMHKNRHKYLDRYESVGIEVLDQHLEIEVSGQTVEVDHFPYIGDSHDKDRFVDWRPKDNGSWLLCGHVHDSWRQRGKQINVGVDAWNGYPVSEDIIARMIELEPQNLEVGVWK
jgi:calcineurin-like phosphoesterase family protein